MAISPSLFHINKPQNLKSPNPRHLPFSLTRSSKPPNPPEPSSPKPIPKPQNPLRPPLLRPDPTRLRHTAARSADPDASTGQIRTSSSEQRRHASAPPPTLRRPSPPTPPSAPPPAENGASLGPPTTSPPATFADDPVSTVAHGRSPPVRRASSRSICAQCTYSERCGQIRAPRPATTLLWPIFTEARRRCRPRTFFSDDSNAAHSRGCAPSPHLNEILTFCI